MKIIGVTGGIGSGKSTVSSALRDLGAAVIDADAIARALAGKGGKMLKELTDYFGTDILDSNGELDRRKLANIAFNDPVKHHALDAITHKYITAKIVDGIENIKASGKYDVVVLDVPIPVKHGFMDLVDEVWVVTADIEKRIERVMGKTGFEYEEVLNRINAQVKDEEYIEMADEVICNNGSIEELEKAVVKLFIQRKQDRQR